MIGWAFAAALLAFPLVAWVAIRRIGVDREGTRGRICVAVLAVLLLGWFAFVWNQHLCGEGNPPLHHYALVFLPPACVFVLGRRRGPAILLAAGMGLAGFLLLDRWTSTVHSGTWTGNPDQQWYEEELPMDESKGRGLTVRIEVSEEMDVRTWADLGPPPQVLPSGPWTRWRLPGGDYIEGLPYPLLPPVPPPDGTE